MEPRTIQYNNGDSACWVCQLMEFDLDYELVEWDGKPIQITEYNTGLIKTILGSGSDDFSVKEIGINNMRLEDLWKAGLIKKYASIKTGARPRTRWGPDYEGIWRHLSQDPEIYRLLQKRARRKQSLVQADRFASTKRFSDCRVSHSPPKRSGRR